MTTELRTQRTDIQPELIEAPEKDSRLPSFIVPSPSSEQAGTSLTDAGRRPRVVIVGAGFGGIYAARVLGNHDVDVLLLSRADYHGFWMLLYQVASAQLTPTAIASPVGKLLRRYRNIRFQVADVRGVDLEHKLVHTEDAQIPYDYLILAAGSSTNYFGHDNFRARTLSLHDLEEAKRIRDRVLAAFAQAAREADPVRQAALMTVVVVGGGPTGVELAGAFAELIYGQLAHDYPSLDMRATRVVLIENSDSILSTFPVGLRRAALRALKRRGVEIRLGAAVTNVDGARVILSDGSSINGQTIIWAAGVRGSPLGDALGVALSRAGRVRVEPTLNLPGRPEVFVVGDMAYLEDNHGDPYPMVAQVAMQMGKQAGSNILAQIVQQPARPFSYFDFGQMAMVGRGAGLFDSHGIHLSGLIGWLLWLSVHLFYLPGLHNRFVALKDWIAALFGSTRSTTPVRAHKARRRAPGHFLFR